MASLHGDQSAVEVGCWVTFGAARGYRVPEHLPRSLQRTMRRVAGAAFLDAAKSFQQFWGGDLSYGAATDPRK